MVFSGLSKLEMDIIDTYGRFSGILGRLQHIEYDLKVKKSPSGMTHVSIRPQRGCILSVQRYPNEIKIPEDTNTREPYIIIDDVNGGLQKRFIKYLQRELPYIKIKTGED